MKRCFWQTLYLVLLFTALLAGCGGDDDAVDSSDSDTESDTENSAQVTDGNEAENIAVTYDPGPYFTPRRSAPENPQTFIPDEQVDAFRRTTLSGSCTDQGGLTAQYVDETNSIVYLQCRYLNRGNSAEDAIQELISGNTLTGQPIVLKLQGAESFLLGTSGQAYVFAWTHENWFFLVRSLYGRESLDAFMGAFSY
ncbi:MAG TPA: hypothetical protein VJZ27_06695 [Aggregatilineales bacterium]|nr:hypothetical protein [Aggregatilineales bacterium]